MAAPKKRAESERTTAAAARAACHQRRFRHLCAAGNVEVAESFRKGPFRFARLVRGHNLMGRHNAEKNVIDFFYNQRSCRHILLKKPDKYGCISAFVSIKNKATAEHLKLFM